MLEARVYRSATRDFGQAERGRGEGRRGTDAGEAVGEEPSVDDRERNLEEGLEVLDVAGETALAAASLVRHRCAPRAEVRAAVREALSFVSRRVVGGVGLGVSRTCEGGVHRL